MMQILQAAGIPLFTDGKRPADASNERGYHEHERAASLLTSPDKSWLTNARGHAIKVVAPLLAALPCRMRSVEVGMRNDSESKPELPTPNSEFPIPNSNLRILFMERSMNEILESQSSMLERLGKEPPRGDVTRGYLQQSRHAKTWITTRGIPALGVRYEDLVHNSDEILPRVAAFLGAEDKLEAMREVIDPNLHRARAGEPVAPAATSV
jgi:hypothetical protein